MVPVNFDFFHSKNSQSNTFRKHSFYCLSLHTSHTIGKYNIVSIISLPVKTGPGWRHGQNIVLNTKLGASIIIRPTLYILFPVLQFAMARVIIPSLSFRRQIAFSEVRVEGI